MKFNLSILVLASFFAVACSTTRDPASVKKERDQVHQQYQGTFDGPIQ